MPEATPEAARHIHGWPEKRRAIATAAIGAFARDGFARANVTAIAAEAGVSKRTLYKHYGDKEQLFRAVVEDVVTSLQQRFTQTSDLHLRHSKDIRAGLIAFGLAWIRTFLLAPDLIALRRLLVAEGAHFPSLIEAWRRAGPDPVNAVVRDQLSRLHDRGLLNIPDTARAVDHLAALLLYRVNNRVLFGLGPIPEQDIEDYVTDGVDAFLRMYAPPTTTIAD
ncbi:TetR/AcrR family transcriptional regulator C-terminal domain-containing protein [Pseudonocardia phyllosphaerae]|uniref:TetR/AcrR family transcriptional regulator C-terminal domain-containing protein n=1 Tax=Pseudonocardia phyllosphaerae TaxID=3390502 RepID=UPI0039794685